MAAGATAAAAQAGRGGRGAVPFALLGIAGAVAGSVAGPRWRAAAAHRGWPPVRAALAEDAVVILLAATVAAARPRTPAEARDARPLSVRRDDPGRACASR
jgi:uncharacterized membrane protein YeaQ/YmgE (transglycosylase-associated protein family)